MDIAPGEYAIGVDMAKEGADYSVETAPSDDDGLREEIKATILRPLADKFQELTRQIDSGEYKLPKTLEEAQVITEDYIDQAWERLEALTSQKIIEARIEGGIKQLEWVYYQQKINPDDDGIVARILKERIASLTTKQNTKEGTE
jgi:hypothetical protein